MTAPQAPTPCSVCGKTFPANQLDLTADGPRCFACGQQAAVRQFEVDRAAEIASHNRSVLVGSGFRFWRLNFHCTECNTRVGSAPPLLGFRAPPAKLACGKCGATFGVPFTFRAAWFSSLFLKGLFPIALLTQVGRFRAAFATGGGVEIASVAVLAFAYALFPALLLAVPAALLTGKRRGS